MKASKADDSRDVSRTTSQRYMAFTRVVLHLYNLEEVEKINPSLIVCDPDGQGLHRALRSSERCC
jgi:hypothetical protein